MSSLVLVRHGETAWNAERRCMGRLPIPLSPEGESQSARLALALRRFAPARILSSPLERTSQTAALIARALGSQVETEARLSERDMPAWEGQYYSDLARDPAVRDSLGRSGSVTPAGVEPLSEVVRRVAEVIEESWKQERSLVLVTHGDVVRCAVAHLLGMDLDRVMRLAVDPASATRFVQLPWGPTLRSMNWRPPLPPEAP